MFLSGGPSGGPPGGRWGELANTDGGMVSAERPSAESERKIGRRPIATFA